MLNFANLIEEDSVNAYDNWTSPGTENHQEVMINEIAHSIFPSCGPNPSHQDLDLIQKRALTKKDMPLYMALKYFDSRSEIKRIFYWMEEKL